MTDKDEARKDLQEAIETSKDKECKGGTCVIVQGMAGQRRREERRSSK